jgi:hypothetical protein
MDKLLRILSCIALLSALAGCATSTLMTEVASPEIRPPAPDKVKIVFMRTSLVAAHIPAEIFEVVDGQLNFVGELVKGTKIVYETTPGKKVFMASGGPADFMLGDLSGGKIYYSIVRPNYGTGGMIPTPVKAYATNREFSMASPEFTSWVAETKLVAPNAEAKDWFSKEKARYQDNYTDYWSRFQRKTPEEKAERTLGPQDGVLK